MPNARRYKISNLGIIAAYFLIIGNLSYASNNGINQLLSRLPNSKAQEKLSILNQLTQYYSDYDFSKAFHYTDQAIALATSLNDSLGLAQALYNKGLLHQLRGDNNGAYQSLKRAYTIYGLSHNSIGIAQTGDCLGSLFRYYGAFEKSLEYHLRSLKIYEEVNDTAGMISAMNNIGIVYRNLENYPKAISYYQKAIHLAKPSKSNKLSTVYTSIGSYHWYLNQYDSALYYYQAALDIPPVTLALKERHCATLNNMGNVYRSMKQHPKALYYYNQSLKESNALGLINLSAITLKNLGIVHIQQGDSKKAVSYILQSIALCEQSNLKQVQRDNYLLLSDLYIKQANYKEAMGYHKRYSVLQDSIYQTEQSSKVALLEVDYLIQQKEKDLAVLMKKNVEKKLEIQRSRNLLVIVMLIAIILGLSAAGFYRLFRINKKASQGLLRMNEELEGRVKRRTEKLEQEIASHKITAAELVKAKEKAEESDKLKSAFLANLSHEIRTPLNAILGFTGLLANKEINDLERDQYISIANRSGNYLLSIINDIIEISKIEAGQILINNTRVRVNALMTELYESFQLELPEENGVTLNMSIPQEELTISADEVKLRQVMTNLIGNALKFTEKGGIKFGYTIKGERELTFYVIDTGIGIKVEDCRVIFDRFRQLEGDNTRKRGGSGLGLAISKAYIEKMGGTIMVESEVGKGSIFSFTLPVTVMKNQPKEPNPIPKQEDKSNAIPKSAPQITILIAEDDNLNYKLLERLLKGFEFKLLRAHNGQEAVDICLNNDHINLVLMDIKMPILNGYQALKKIREERPFLNIIAQTAYALSDDYKQVMEAGFDGYITKPFERDNLIETILKGLKYQ